jgi:hypothetical protein
MVFAFPERAHEGAFSVLINGDAPRKLHRCFAIGVWFPMLMCRILVRLKPFALILSQPYSRLFG